MTTFYIVRHGETDYNKTGRYQGQMDIPLNEEGRRQARLIAARMAAAPLDVVYSSDLSRAQETARLVAGARTVALEPRLREIHVGRVMGLKHPEIAEREPEFWAAFAQDQDHVPFPDGESAVQVQERAMEALTAMQARYPSGHVAVVTHGGVIKCIMAAVLGLPLRARERIYIDNCSLSLIEWNERGRRVRSLNDIGHLVEAPCEVKADF